MEEIVVSIIVPTYNEEAYVENNIKSMLECGYPRERMELLYVDGMSTDRTREIIREYARRHGNIRLLDNPRQKTPFALNIGVRAAGGRYTIACGAHSELGPDYIRLLVEFMETGRAQAAGGRLVTSVYHLNPKSAAIKKVLTNRYGVGNADYRIEGGGMEIREADTAGFLCYRRDYLLDIGGYNEKLIRNQDIELNKRIRKNGGRIYLVPQAVGTYYARETYGAVARNNFGNGMWNPLTVCYTGDWRSLSLRHFVPLIFLLSLILPLAAAFAWPPLAGVAALSFLAYNGLVIFQSFKMKDDTTTLPHLVKAFYTLHFSYGWGSLTGIFKALKLKLLGE